MPHRSYMAKEKNSASGHKAAKDRLALLLGGNDAGDFKLKSLLIYRAENPRPLKTVWKSSRPVPCKSKKAWVTLNTNAGLGSGS